MFTLHSLSSLKISSVVAATGNSGGNPLVTFGFMGAIGAAMYFLMIRPQRRRLKESQELQRAIEEDDYVITNSGLCGYIKRMTSDFIWLEIDDSVLVRFSRSAILRKIDPQLEEEEEEGE